MYRVCYNSLGWNGKCTLRIVDETAVNTFKTVRFHG